MMYLTVTCSRNQEKGTTMKIFDEAARKSEIDCEFMENMALTFKKVEGKNTVLKVSHRKM